MKGGLAGVPGDRPAETLDGLFAAAQLVGDDPQQMPGAGLRGLGVEDPPANLLGLLQSSRLTAFRGHGQAWEMVAIVEIMAAERGRDNQDSAKLRVALAHPVILSGSPPSRGPRASSPRPESTGSSISRCARLPVRRPEHG